MDVLSIASIAKESVGIIAKSIIYVQQQKKWLDIFNNGLGNTSESIDGTKTIFGKNDAKHIAKKIAKESGFDLKQSLTDEITLLFKSKGLDDENNKEIISSFVNDVIEKIKDTRPELVERQLINEIHKNVKKVNETPLAFDIDTIDLLLSSNSNPNYDLDLSYYELNDFIFEERFDEELAKESNIFIQYYSREEALYRILNHLKQSGHENVYVVTNEQNWEKIGSSNVNGKILIPSFDYASLNAIDNNINIFICLDSKYHENDSKYIPLRKRTKTNIREALQRIGVDSNVITRYLNETNGLFVPLQRKLINGDNNAFNIEYEVDLYDRLKISRLLLIKQWTEKDFDIIEQYCGIDDIQQFFVKYSTGEDPLLIKAYDFSEKEVYKFSCYSIALFQFSNNLTLKEKKCFIDFVFNILENHIDCSSALIEGCLESIINVYYSSPSSIKQYIRQSYEQYEQSMKNYKQFFDNESNLEYFCDIFPESILSLLKLIFDNYPNEVATHIDNYHYTIQHLLEKLLQDDRYFEESVDLAVKIYDYTSGNKLDRLLKETFCLWFNFLPDQYKRKKVETASKLIKKYRYFWNIVYGNLPNNNSFVSGEWPSQGSADRIDHSVFKDDYIKDVCGFYRLCVDNADGDLDRITKLLDDSHSFPSEELIYFIDSVRKIKESYSDLEKAKLVFSIRHFIHKNRYFKDANWTMEEGDISLFESLLDEITYSSNEYSLFYLFKNSYDGVLLNPIPFKDDDYREGNDDATNTQRSECLTKYLNDNGDLAKLIRIFKDCDSCCLGGFIASCKDNSLFNKETFNIVIENDSNINRPILKQYLSAIAGRNFDVYSQVVDYAKTLPISSPTFVDVLNSFYDYDDRLIDILNSVDEQTKKEYWRVRRIYSNKVTTNGAASILNDVLLYGNLSVFFDYLHSFQGLLGIDDIYSFIMLSQKLPLDDNFKNQDAYEIKEVLKALEPLLDDEEKSKELCAFEIRFQKYLEWDDMIFSNYCFSYFAEYYGKVIANNFKTKGEISEKYKDDKFGFGLYYSCHFCPGFKGNVFDSDVFDKWVTEFRVILKNNGRSYIFDHTIGRLLAFSNADIDGIVPVNHIRKFIENNFSNELENSFIISEMNKRGVYTVDDGNSTLRLYSEYLRKAKQLKEEGYEKCAKIYETISEDYKKQGDFERKRSES